MNIQDLRIDSRKGTDLIREAVSNKDLNYSQKADDALKEILEPLTSERVELEIYRCLHHNCSADEIVQSILMVAYGNS